MSPGQKTYETFKARLNQHDGLLLEDLFGFLVSNDVPGILKTPWDDLDADVCEWWEQFAMALSMTL